MSRTCVRSSRLWSISLAIAITILLVFVLASAKPSAADEPTPGTGEGTGTTTPEEIIHTISDDRQNPLEEPVDSSADPAPGGEDLIAPPPADSDADLAAEAQPAGEALVSSAIRDGAGDGSSSQYVLLIAVAAVAGLSLGTIVWRARRSRS